MDSRTSKKYKEWKRLVLERDGYKCKHCGGWHKGIELQVHHIFKWHLYPKLRYDVRNGIVLCKDCHKLYDKNERIIWQVKYRKIKRKYEKLKVLYKKLYEKSRR